MFRSTIIDSLNCFFLENHKRTNVAQLLLLLGLKGLIVGLLVLGVGGRTLMRFLAFITPELPRFTFIGTLVIIGAGAAWGGLTAPLLMVLARWRPRSRRIFGLLFGLIVMMLALILFIPLSGFDGRIVAPRLFIVGTIVLFPPLFIVHGIVLGAITRKHFSPL